tara:strand:+ start:514 stop:702 length:189 start_codon:yes stop_codon:yes gene_type:complete
MSIVKEQYSEYIERIEDAVVCVVDNMDLNALTQYAVQQMSDYFINKASSEEIEQLLNDNEPL